MAYSLNPNLPRLRAKAVDMVKLEGKSIRQAARYFGFNASTVSRWVRKSPKAGCWKISTLSSRPRRHPHELKTNIVSRIIEIRRKTGGRCAEVIHKMLLNEGVKVGLSSVKRTLDRHGLTRKKSKWKRYHKSLKRPKVRYPGDLVQIDTIHLMDSPKGRIYVYTLLDVYSRWAYAEASEKINTINSIRFVKKAQKLAPFSFNHLQSDNGSEFSKQFTERVKIKHRHSRVRQPNDNAHLERFNRTIQTELIRNLPSEVKLIQKALPGYLDYYNKKRLRLGIDLQTPTKLITKCCKGID